MRRGARPLRLCAAVAAGAFGLASGPATSQPANAPASPADDKALIARGEALFSQHCAVCHEPPIEGAPSPSDLAEYNPQAVTEILKTGPMKAMARDLSDTDIEAVNRFLHAY